MKTLMVAILVFAAVTVCRPASAMPEPPSPFSSGGYPDHRDDGHHQHQDGANELEDANGGMTTYRARPIGGPMHGPQASASGQYLPPQRMSGPRPSAQYGAPQRAQRKGPSFSHHKQSSPPFRPSGPSGPSAGHGFGGPSGHAGHRSLQHMSGRGAATGKFSGMASSGLYGSSGLGQDAGNGDAGYAPHPGHDGPGSGQQPLHDAQSGSFSGRGSFSGHGSGSVSGHGSGSFSGHGSGSFSGHGSGSMSGHGSGSKSGHGSGSKSSAGVSPRDMYARPGAGYSSYDRRGGQGGQDDEEGMSEDAMYQFEYSVGADAADQDAPQFGQHEERDGEVTRGTYHVLLPDGRLQRVDYEADENGFRPTVSFEDQRGGGSSGGSSGPY